MKHLKLKVNTDKSGVDIPSKRGFLGFRIVKNPKYVRGIAPKSIELFKRRIRQLTRRNRSVSMEERIRVLSLYLKGWRAYYGYCQTPDILTRLDGWIRRRLRSIYWKQWKIYRRRKRTLKVLRKVYDKSLCIYMQGYKSFEHIEKINHQI